MTDYLPLIRSRLHQTLDSTDFPALGQKLRGKVRDIYDRGQELLFITTDRQSAFDRNLALVPFKGQVLTQTSIWWYGQTADILPNHYLSSPDPAVMIGRKMRIFPVEFVVRGYLTGITSTSVWTAYAKGEREYCGHRLPEGMKKNQPLPQPLLTPTTKSDLHDEKNSAAEIVAQGLMTQAEWDEAGALSPRAGPGGRPRTHPGGYQVRVGGGRERPHPSL